MLESVADIMKDVRIALDENEVTNSILETDSNTLTMNEIIRQKLIHAARWVGDTAPSELLSDGSTIDISTPLLWNKKIYGMGSLVLPSDYLRMVRFKMKGWNHPVAHFLTDIDDRYKMQYSEHIGVRGNPINPVCAIIEAGSDRKRLEFYSCDDDTDSIEYGIYIPIPAIYDERLNVPTRCRLSLIYYAAALTAITYGNQNAETLFKLASQHI